MARYVLLAFIFFRIETILAQVDNFAPPPPPPIDEDEPEFDDFDSEEDPEITQNPGRPFPPLPGGVPNGVPPSMPNFSRGQDYRPSGTGGNNFSSSQTGKLRFQIVEGEYWQKGQKRPRGKFVP